MAESSWKEMTDQYEKNWQALMEADKRAKAKGVIKNRYIRHAYADGYAIYRIIRVHKNTVRIRVATGLGDDWILPAWGEECSIPRKLAQQFVDREDVLREMFGGEDA